MVINYFPVYMKQLYAFMMTHFLSFQAWLLWLEILLMFVYWQHAKVRYVYNGFLCKNKFLINIVMYTTHYGDIVVFVMIYFMW